MTPCPATQLPESAASEHLGKGMAVAGVSFTLTTWTLSQQLATGNRYQSQKLCQRASGPNGVVTPKCYSAVVLPPKALE